MRKTRKVRIISTEEAGLPVKDGDTVSTGGFVSSACPESLPAALEKRFLDQMDFTPCVAEDWKLMDARIFREEKMRLAKK